MYKKIIIVFILISFIFAGCASQKPADIRLSVWNEGKDLYYMIDKRMMNSESITEEENDRIDKFSNKYSDLTYREIEITILIESMALFNIMNNIGRETNDKTLELKSFSSYMDESKKFKSIYKM